MAQIAEEDTRDVNLLHNQYSESSRWTLSRTIL